MKKTKVNNEVNEKLNLGEVLNKIKSDKRLEEARSLKHAMDEHWIRITKSTSYPIPRKPYLSFETKLIIAVCFSNLVALLALVNSI